MNENEKKYGLNNYKKTIHLYEHGEAYDDHGGGEKHLLQRQVISHSVTQGEAHGTTQAPVPLVT